MFVECLSELASPRPGCQLPPPLQVAPQPLWFSDTVANLRKLKELPHHLAHSGRIEELKQEVLGKDSERVSALHRAPVSRSLGRVKGKSQNLWLLLRQWFSPGSFCVPLPTAGDTWRCLGTFWLSQLGERGAYWHLVLVDNTEARNVVLE